MSAPTDHQLIGCWRIVEADIWDRNYLDLCGPATVTIGAGNHGEIAFGAMQATLEIGYGPSMVFFTWEGFDEMDEVGGEGDAELLDHGTIEITFAYHNGDEATLKAIRETSSTTRLPRPCFPPTVPAAVSPMGSPFAIPGRGISRGSQRQRRRRPKGRLQKSR